MKPNWMIRCTLLQALACAATLAMAPVHAAPASAGIVQGVSSSAMAAASDFGLGHEVSSSALAAAFGGAANGAQAATEESLRYLPQSGAAGSAMAFPSDARDVAKMADQYPGAGMSPGMAGSPGGALPGMSGMSGMAGMAAMGGLGGLGGGSVADIRAVAEAAVRSYGGNGSGLREMAASFGGAQGGIQAVRSAMQAYSSGGLGEGGKAELLGQVAGLLNEGAVQEILGSPEARANLQSMVTSLKNGGSGGLAGDSAAFDEVRRVIGTAGGGGGLASLSVGDASALFKAGLSIAESNPELLRQAGVAPGLLQVLNPWRFIGDNIIPIILLGMFFIFWTVIRSLTSRRR